jgi:hypothetical protein
MNILLLCFFDSNTMKTYFITKFILWKYICSCYSQYILFIQYMTLLYSVLGWVLRKYIVILIFIVLYSSKRNYFGRERHPCAC